jgi:hypothetical protein
VGVYTQGKFHTLALGITQWRPRGEGMVDGTVAAFEVAHDVDWPAGTGEDVPIHGSRAFAEYELPLAGGPDAVPVGMHVDRPEDLQPLSLGHA